MYFFGVSFSNQRIDQLFDLSRLVLQPDFARKAHITLRGPYKRKPSSRNWIGAQLEPIVLSKPDVFFNNAQHTVFIRCEIPFINDNWYKPDYPDGTPHLSIYDGGDRKFAWQVMQSLQKFPWNIELVPTKMKVINSKEVLETSYLVNSKKYENYWDDIGVPTYTMEQLKEMHIGQRIFLFEKICRRIHFLNKVDVSLFDYIEN